MAVVDASRLQSILLTSGLQQRDNALYQVINQLIVGVSKLAAASSSSSSSGGSSVTTIKETLIQQLIESHESSDIMFMDGPSVSAAVSSVDRQWSVLTNGNTINPELIFAGGDVIMVHTP